MNAKYGGVQVPRKKVIIISVVCALGLAGVTVDSEANAAGVNGITIQSIVGAPYPGFFLAGNGASQHAASSTDGRFVVYETDEDNWDPNDTNISTDIYLRDNLTGTSTRLTNRGADGGEPDDASYAPSMSYDGRYVSFVTNADGFATTDSNFNADAYRFDRATGVYARASFANFGNGGNGIDDGFDYVTDAAISPDGAAVVFATDNGMTPLDLNEVPDVYLRDFANNTFSRISASRSNAPLGGGGTNPSLSYLGCNVAFDSDSVDIVANDNNGLNDVFVARRCGAQSLQGRTRISVSASGGDANGPSMTPKLSLTGRYLAFISRATNLVAPATNVDGTRWQAYVRDRDTDADGVLDEAGSVATTLVSTNAGQGADADVLAPSISPDGCHVVFTSTASNLGGASSADVFLVNWCAASSPLRISAALTGNSNSPSHNPIFSPDGDQVVFDSGASNLIAGDTNSQTDVFTSQWRADSHGPDLANTTLDVPSTSVWITSLAPGNFQPSWNGWDPSRIATTTITRGRYAWDKGGAGTTFATLYANTPDTSAVFSGGSYGTTYCLRVARETDGAGNISSGVGATTCRALPLKASSLSVGSGWTTYSPAGAYTSNVYRSTVRNATATRTRVAGRRLAVIATTCSTCGTIDVLWNGAVLKHIDLHASITTRNVPVSIATWSAPKTGTLTIKVTSSGKPVIIEGLGVFNDQ